MQWNQLLYWQVLLETDCDDDDDYAKSSIAINKTTETLKVLICQQSSQHV